MKYVLIAKTRKYGELFYEKESHEILQVKEKRNSSRKLSEGNHITPPLFFTVLIISVISPWVWILLSKAGVSHPILIFSVLFVLFLVSICFFENKKLYKRMAKANRVDIQALEHIEQQDLLREIEIASVTLFSNVNRFLGVLLLLVFFSLCIGLFYEFPSNLRLVYMGINELAVYLYIVSFTSRRRRENIFRQIRDSVEV